MPGLITPPVRLSAGPAALQAVGDVRSVTEPPIVSGDWPRNPYNTHFLYVLGGSSVAMGDPLFRETWARTDAVVHQGLGQHATGNRSWLYDNLAYAFNVSDNNDRLCRMIPYRCFAEMAMNQPPDYASDHHILQRFIVQQNDLGFLLKDHGGRICDSSWAPTARNSYFYLNYFNRFRKNYLDKDGRDMWRRCLIEMWNDLADGNESTLGENGAGLYDTLADDLCHSVYWDVMNELHLSAKSNRAYGTITEVISPTQYRVNFNRAPNMSARRNCKLAPDGEASTYYWQGLCTDYDASTGILTLSSRFATWAGSTRDGKVGEEIWVGENFNITGDWNADGTNDGDNSNVVGGGGWQYREGVKHFFSQLETLAAERSYPMMAARVGNTAMDVRRRLNPNSGISWPFTESQFYRFWDLNIIEHFELNLGFVFGARGNGPYNQCFIQPAICEPDNCYRHLQGSEWYLRAEDEANLPLGRCYIGASYQAIKGNGTMNDLGPQAMTRIESSYFTAMWCILQLAHRMAHAANVGVKYPCPVAELTIFCGDSLRPSPLDMGEIYEDTSAFRPVLYLNQRSPDWGEAGYSKVFNIDPATEWLVPGATNHYRVLVTFNWRNSAFPFTYDWIRWDPADPGIHPATDPVKDKIVFPTPGPGRKWVAFDEQNYICPKTGRRPLVSANPTWNDGHDALPTELLPPLMGRAWLEVDDV